MGVRKKIAVFATGYAANILAQFMCGLRKGFAPYRVETHLFLCFPAYSDTPEFARGELNIFNLPDLSNYDGAILFANTIDQPGVADSLVKRCMDAGIPVISHGKILDNAYNIVSDNKSGMYELMEHLVDEHDVQKVCILSGTKDSFDAITRRDAVIEIMEKRGISVPDEDIFFTGWSSIEAAGFINELVTAGRVPDAIICANDDIAITACITLKENGLKVPEDVIVSGFDHIPESETFYPSIATIDQQFEEHGEYAAVMMHDLCEGGKRDKLVELPCRFMRGESCCGSTMDESTVALRRDYCTESYVMHNKETKLNIYTFKLEKSILASGSYGEMKEKIHDILKVEHPFVGDVFHFFADPKPFLYESDEKKNLIKSGYNKKMDVVFSIDNGEVSDIQTFETASLFPETGDDENHLYVFTPLHDDEYSTGYLVFCDCYESIKNRVIRAYQQRIDVAFEKFIQNLRLQYLNKRVIELSHVDPLTHVKNRIAYESKVGEIVERIKEHPEYRFAVAMFDVNNLKLINDELGHEAGDEYLYNSCRVICNVFKHSPVYRIGGDEFVAILEDADYNNRDDLMKEFASELERIRITEQSPMRRVSIAGGIGVYDPAGHVKYDDICREADANMYENKRQIKEKYSLGKIR
ncbi:MAG: GGDEF domain-containing protein [Lachnospiraceae bacterium]|nr:GGDEF domain-containing protein [Lachnospiraceae bacterium]